MCPLCKSYLEVTTSKISWHRKQYLNEHLTEGFEELKEKIEDCSSSSTLLRLRSFYCIELMYHRLMPKVLLKLGCSAEHVEISKLYTPRSYAGLRELYRKLESLEEEVHATRIDADFEGRAKLKEVSASVRMKTHFSEFLELVTLCKEASVILRRELNKKQPTKLHLVGRNLALACDAASETDTRRLEYGRRLIRVNESEPLSPFQEDWT